jgi:hypothetical protein
MCVVSCCVVCACDIVSCGVSCRAYLEDEDVVKYAADLLGVLLLEVGLDVAEAGLAGHLVDELLALQLLRLGSVEPHPEVHWENTHVELVLIVVCGVCGMCACVCG